MVEVNNIYVLKELYYVGLLEKEAIKDIAEQHKLDDNLILEGEQL